MIEHNLKEVLWPEFKSECKADNNKITSNLIEACNRQLLQSSDGISRNIDDISDVVNNTSKLPWKKHPIHAMITEHRSVVIMALPRVHELLSYRMRTHSGDRVRAIFDQFGAQTFKSKAARPTGRLIAYNPSLQCAPKECHYIPVTHWNLQDELEADASKELFISRMIDRNVSVIVRAQNDVEDSKLSIIEGNGEAARRLHSLFGLYDHSTVALTKAYSIGTLRNLQQAANMNESPSKAETKGWWTTVHLRSECEVAGSFPRFVRRGVLSAAVLSADGRSVRTIQTSHDSPTVLLKPCDVTRIDGPIAPDGNELNQLKSSIQNPYPFVTNEEIMESVSSSRRHVKFRDAFAAPKGYVIVAADFSQFELRVLAHFSKVSKLLITVISLILSMYRLLIGS